MNQQPPITLAVLAGGAGTRMGIPKARLTIQGQPILSWLMARWRWDGPTLLVTSPGRSRPPGADSFDREAVDAVADQGPLLGMATALQAIQTDLVVIATCDMPMVRQEHLLWLPKQLLEHPERLGVFLQLRTAQDKQVEPFPCTLRKSAIGSLRDLLESEQRSVRALAESPDFLPISPENWAAETWMNLNRPDDLDQLERLLE